MTRKQLGWGAALAVLVIAFGVFGLRPQTEAQQASAQSAAGPRYTVVDTDATIRCICCLTRYQNLAIGQDRHVEDDGEHLSGSRRGGVPRLQRSRCCGRRILDHDDRPSGEPCRQSATNEPSDELTKIGRSACRWHPSTREPQRPIQGSYSCQERSASSISANPTSAVSRSSAVFMPAAEAFASYHLCIQHQPLVSA